MDTRHRLLAAYDAQLRMDAEATGAVSVLRRDPLLLLTFPGDRGFITYRDLGSLDEPAIRRLVGEALEELRQRSGVSRIEWKTRGHDHAPGLHEALLDHGFVPDEPESIMIGDARGLAVDVELPAGVRLRRVTAERDVRAMCAMQDDVFGESTSSDMVAELLQRLAAGDGPELWIAEAAGQVVSAGRLEAVPGTDFAGIWGGATRPEWRGRGIYRALTAARARSALRQGKTLLHSDSTEFSRPILERSGLLKVSTTTPYLWRG